MKLRYTYKLRPGKLTTRALLREWGVVRFTWMSVAEYKTGNKPTFSKLNTKLTALRAEHEWLREGASVPQQQCLRKYDKALKHSFTVKGRGRPRFKKKTKTLPTLEYTRSGFTIKDNKLCLAKIPPIPVVWSRELPSEPSTATVYQDAVGDWWVSFIVEVDDPEPLPPVNKAIGIDPGVKRPVTTTDPAFDVEYQAHGRSKQVKLARYQRMMARRYQKGVEKQSKGYLKANKSTAKLHRKIRNQRKERWRSWGQQVCRTYDNIALEDFKPKFINRNRRTSRKSYDIALGLMKRTLIETATKTGRNLVLVNPRDTSRTCSGCEARTTLTLADRVYNCKYCGLCIDRDLNAAINILKWAGFNPPNEENIRLLSSSELAAV